ncbi:hypothetical protein J5N97_029731 [Dioscorea zingiberensis]|uniref:Pectinesterase inhibitor domain-containing protein n=1 Tax=Dioscorea zingiberensis TaxID=325984 RepID=A0A9D5BWA9_9LILI|nr:hypothetical protein J5N97_029731 [Dioscorea zingiberensis]
MRLQPREEEMAGISAGGHAGNKPGRQKNREMGVRIKDRSVVSGPGKGPVRLMKQVPGTREPLFIMSESRRTVYKEAERAGLGDRASGLKTGAGVGKIQKELSMVKSIPMPELSIEVAATASNMETFNFMRIQELCLLSSMYESMTFFTYHSNLCLISIALYVSMLQLLAALAGADLVQDTCKQSGDLKDLCVQALTSDPKSEGSEEHGLARVPLGLTACDATGAANELLKMVEHTSAHKEELMQCLEDCNEEYEDVVQ